MISYVSQSPQTTNLGVRGSNPFGRAIQISEKYDFFDLHEAGRLPALPFQPDNDRTHG